MNLNLKKYFWGAGGGEDIRKIAWVDWDTVCLSKEEGGLGVRRLREFNIALFGKWCWHMLVDKEGLWYRALKARYSEEGDRLRHGGGNSSVWWRMMCGLHSGEGLGVDDESIIS